MRSEADAPIRERSLWLEGKVSSKSLELIKSGLPSTWPPGAEVLFVGFAYADLPLTKQFEVVFPRNKPQEGVRCGCRIIATTQQFGKPFPEVPHGWKTVCVLQFSGDVPEMVQRLPVVDSWYQNKDWVCLCDEATWECLKNGG